MNNTDSDTIHAQVQQGYGSIATSANASSCCGGSSHEALAHAVGYSSDELAHIPDEANLGLSCGNPTAIAALKPGEVVVDLGSGAGMDAFLAAQQVTPTGRVIGIDMTPEMLTLARKNADTQGVSDYVEFREGLIEDLPVESGSVDAVISNCVINLSPDKSKVFEEAFRVLKPGARLAVSDILLTHPLPEAVREHVPLYVACLSGALLADDYIERIKRAGFENVRWTRTPAAAILEATSSDLVFLEAWNTIPPEQRQKITHSIWSYRIEANRPCTPSPTN